MSRYSRIYSNYVLRKKHQTTNKGVIYERDWVTIGGQHQIEKGKKPYYRDTNFLFTENTYPSYKKRYGHGKWIATNLSYNDVKDAKEDTNIVKVNETSNDLRDFAYYGSATELVKASIENIIKWFPATVKISLYPIYYPTDDCGVEVLEEEHYIFNPFEIDFIHTLSNLEEELYNTDRYMMHSYGNYTINGSVITHYSLTNRKFMYKEITTEKRTKKEFTASFSIERIENVNTTVKHQTVTFKGKELVTSNKLSIDLYPYTNKTINSDVKIDNFNKTNGTLSIGNSGYTAINYPSFYNNTSKSVRVTLTVNGYGIAASNTKSVTASTAQRKALSVSYDSSINKFTNVKLFGGYTYTIGDGILTPNSTQTTTFVYSANGRTLSCTVDGNNYVFNISGELSQINEYKHEIKNLSFTGVKEDEENTLTETFTLQGINVNHTISMGNVTMSNWTCRIMVSNSYGTYYPSDDNVYSLSNKALYYNVVKKCVSTSDGSSLRIDISDANESILSHDFTFYFLRKNEVVLTGYTFTVHPSTPMPDNIETGDYFLEIDGNKIDWRFLCHRNDDRPKSFGTKPVKARIYMNNLQFLDENNVELLGAEGIDVMESDTLDNISLYKRVIDYPPYTFMQCVEEQHTQAFLNDGWKYLSGYPNLWLPISKMNVDWNSYIGNLGREDCYVSVLKSYISKDVNSYYEGINMPLYTVYITTEDNSHYELKAYIIDGEVKIMTKSQPFDLGNLEYKYEEYFNNVKGFEKQLLTRVTNPHYKNMFLTPIEGELSYKYVLREYTWPSTYNEETGYSDIDISSEAFFEYVNKLIELSSKFDELWCDNIYRSMTHESIKNFDWTYTREYIDGEEVYNVEGGERVMKLLRVFGRAFDDIKRHVDGIGFVNRNSYDGYDNQPDAEISDRLETMGWDIVSTIPNFTESNQCYVSNDGNTFASETEYNSMSEQEKSDYQKAYINSENANIINETVYNNVKDTSEGYLYSEYKRPLDLLDVTIGNLSEINGYETWKWFDSTMPDMITPSVTDIEFLRRLFLSSRRIFNTKGTVNSIEMVMALFGLGIDEDYSIKEKYYTVTNIKPYDGIVENETITYGELAETLNELKYYPKQYEDIYSGIPLKDVEIDGKRYLVPFYSQERTYDGDFVFQSRGGWFKDEGKKRYSETLSYLHIVSNFADLLTLDPSSLNGDDIYYVVDYLSCVGENYKNLSEAEIEKLSHFFMLKKECKLLPNLPESWMNIDFTSHDAEMLNNVERAKYLDSIMTIKEGNNPHTGYGQYDEGKEYLDYMKKPFKYSDEFGLIDTEWSNKTDYFTFNIIEEEGEKVINTIEKTSDETNENSGNVANENNENNEIPEYYLNRKWIEITNMINNDFYKKYFSDVILNYVMQVVPSTSILILKGF